MSNFQTSTPIESLWETHRDDFPVTSRLVYLNHAAVAPLCGPVAAAMKGLADDAWMHGSHHYDQWLAAYEGLRVAAAGMVNAHRDEIAIVKNTSEGIATVALGLDWHSGDRLVAFEEEFPANQYPWRMLEKKGVGITWLSVRDPLDKVDAACRGARLLAVSFVQYLSGFRADLEAIGEICRRHGVFFFVDAIQGLGAFPLDVRKANIQALAADGHKWLLGPEGCGILYIQKDFLDSVAPVEFGWTNVASFSDYASRDMSLRSDACRYECGTLNTIGCFGLRASFEYLNQIGVARIAPAVRMLADRVAGGAAAKGYEVLGDRTSENGSGIVSIRKADIDSRMAVSRLRQERIAVASRQGWVRVSPHFYISPGEIDRMIELLP